MKKFKLGFTLIELLVVISILGLIATIVSVALNNAREQSRIAATIENQRQLQKAVELYISDMGFFPPDTGRGWDPGFAKRLPYNLDKGTDCETNSADCPAVCAGCPTDWVAQVQAKWRGPYIGLWPNNTAWGGKYDYNYWIVPAGRYNGCVVPPGIYIGVQGDYDGTHTIPAASEQALLDKNLDNDGCLDTETQMLLYNPTP